MSDNNSGYVIRFELLKLAREILDQQVIATQERLRMDWDAAEEKYEFPEFPTVTTEDVIAEARKLNEFISSKS